jgi:hypothetical protein
MATSVVHLPDTFAIDEKASVGLIRQMAMLGSTIEANIATYKARSVEGRLLIPVEDSDRKILVLPKRPAQVISGYARVLVATGRLPSTEIRELGPNDRPVDPASGKVYRLPERNVCASGRGL